MVNKRTYRSKNMLKETIKPIQGILNLCRLCLGEAKDGVPIYADKNDICSSLATRIMMCVGYEVTHEDCLPNAICPECHNEINNFYKFKKKCYNTYYTLKTHIFAVRRDIKCEENALKSIVSDCPNNQSVSKISESVNTISQPIYQVSQSVNPVSQSVCPIIQSVCTVNELGCTVTQSVTPVSQLACPISQSGCPISQSVSPVIQSIYPVAQSVSSVSHSVSLVNQSVCPVSLSFSTVNQSVYPVTQSIFTLSESVGPINESICTASQSVYPVTQSVSTIKQSDCPVSQAICTEIHPSSVSQSNCKNLSDNTEYQLVFPLYQSGSQPVTTLVSESVAETRDQLILAFEDVTQLEFIQTELRQNGLHNLMNINEIAEAIEIAVPDKGVEEAKIQEVETTAQTEVCPNFAGYLSAILLEMGILKKSSSDSDVQMTEDCSTIVIDTKDGEHVQLELLQVEDSVPEKMEEQKTSTNETKKASTRATKNSPKRRTDERPQCAVCGRRFASRGVLGRHLRVHTGERPFRCARCGLAFAQREVLRRHELVHQEVRPFACSRCPKSFTQRASLAAHARRHEPPCARSLQMHRCTKCPKMFLHASGLSRHMMTHAGRTFPCALCGRYFSDGSSARRHMRCKHRQPDG